MKRVLITGAEGLIGSVLGGWMASGEPMTFTHHRTRDRVAAA